MRTILPFGLLVFLLAGQAQASGYSMLNAGIAARGHSEPDETIRLLSLAITAPDLPPHLLPVAYLDRGEAYDDKKQYDLAIADFTASLRLKPGSFDAYVQRALSYGELKKFDEEIADLSSAIQIRPDLSSGYLTRGAVNADGKKLDAAVADFTFAIGIDPAAAVGYFLRAEAYRLQDKLDAAQTDIDKVVDLSPQDATAYFTRALIYQDRGKLRDALDDLETGLKYAPGDFDARLHTGLVQWELGRFDDAATTFEQVVKMRPANAYGVLWLEITRIKAGKADDDLARNAAGLDGTKWPAPVVNVFLGKATPDQAIQAASQAGADLTQNQTCEANFYIGEWQLFHQNEALAKPMLQAAAANCPRDFVELPAAIAELKRLS
jgi:tetratricopeptide (TPR) repeat protein